MIHNSPAGRIQTTSRGYFILGVKMDQILQDKLINEFPDLFRGTKKSPQESCMALGCDVENGWFSIVYAASKAISSHLKRLKDAGKPLDFEYAQIKEKFATIRIYDNGGDEFIDGVIAMAEYLSSITCEVCGKSGKLCSTGLDGRGWLKTLCEDDAKKLEYKLAGSHFDPD